MKSDMKLKRYTFFKIQFTNFWLDYKSTIVSSMDEVMDYITQDSVVDILCRPSCKARVTITGIQMTEERI